MYLRQLQKKDIPFMMEWMLDPKINCYFRFDVLSITHESLERFIIDANSETGNIHKAIVNDEDEYYGTVSLKNIDKDKGMAEYAVSTRSVANHKGYGQFATNEILKCAFLELNLQKVYLNCLADNTKAINMYKRCGFYSVPEKKMQVLIRGSVRELLWFEIARENFKI